MRSQKINFYQVRNVGEVISATADFIRDNFKSFFLSILYTTGPFLLLIALVAGLMPYIAGILGIGFGFSFAMFQIGMFVPLLLLAAVFLTGVYQYIVLYIQKNHEEAISVPELWRAIRKNYMNTVKTLIGLFLLAILVYFLVALLIILVVAIGAGMGALLSTFLPSFIVGVVAILAMLCLGAAIFYYVSPIAFLFNVRMMEKLRFGQSVSRCYQLAEGYRWKVVLVLFIVIIVQFVLTAVSIVPLFLTGAVDLLGGRYVFDGANSVLYYAYMALMALLSYMMYTINIVAISFLYGSIREAKESLSLQGKIEDFGVRPEAEDMDREEDIY